MRRYIILFMTVFASVVNSQAQELNAMVTVNSDRIQGTNRNVFTTMEQALKRFINETKWSSTTFANNERIDCTFSLTIVENPSTNTYKAELFVQARRPVYNSSYITSTLNFRDVNLEFEYMENAPLEIVQTTIDNNLVAVTAFYCNLILALDFDSFSLMGGSVFYRQAQSIATQAQSNSSWNGWSTFDNNRSRTFIINAFLDESLKSYRELEYIYHRKGLDEMAANPDRARTTILHALQVLKDIRSVRNSETILQMFADCKLDEIVAIAGKATAEEKKDTYDLLRSVYPASSMQLEPLKK
jgi:hypothetical protein